MSGKYSQKLLGHAKKFVTDALKTSSKQIIQKIAEGTGDLIGNKTANKITKLPKNSPQNNSETVTNEHDKEMPKEKYVFPDEKR